MIAILIIVEILIITNIMTVVEMARAWKKVNDTMETLEDLDRRMVNLQGEYNSCISRLYDYQRKEFDKSRKESKHDGHTEKATAE